MIKDNFITNIIDEDIKNKTFSRKIHLRFPPEPNGYLHIGHAKAIVINFETAKRYSGLCNLRFDDTNPSNEKEDYIKAIEDDIKFLGYEPTKILHASSYFDKLYDYAVTLIKKGLAYIDSDSPKLIKQNRGTLKEKGTESKYKNRSIDENLELFERMKNKEFKNSEHVLRAKIDMASPNMNMRDPIIYRIINEEHPVTKDKWNIYPMYDFAHPLEDYIEGITHSLCTLEFQDHRPLYEWVLNSLELPEPPKQIEFSRLDILDTVMSKRLINDLINQNKLSSFSDPRLPTLIGLRKRGFTSEAIKEFCLSLGVSKENSNVSPAQLEYFLREDLKDKTINKNVVFDPIKVVITNYESEGEDLEVENSKTNPDLGNRKIKFSKEIYIDTEDFMEDPAPKYFRLFLGNEVRLKGAYFIKCNEIIKDKSGNITELRCTYDELTKSGMDVSRKVKGTIHFVESKTKEQIEVHLINPLLKDGEFNDNSLIKIKAYAEESISEIKVGETVQFFRKGYFIKTKEMGEFGPVFVCSVDLKSGYKVK